MGRAGSGLRTVSLATPAGSRRNGRGMACGAERRDSEEDSCGQAAVKRGAALEVPLANLPDRAPEPERSLLALEESLRVLEETDPRKAKLIEMRYFGGLTAEESAAALSSQCQYMPCAASFASVKPGCAKRWRGATTRNVFANRKRSLRRRERSYRESGSATHARAMVGSTIPGGARKRDYRKFSLNQPIIRSSTSF
jgi:ECF sigma factor